ncbi:MAG: hypothetical protein K9M57_11610, partial [Phycisphaerae bacterium]|nr:hypothetical protein [Phycisphaerae bacterium]
MIQCNIALTLMIPFLFSTVCAAVIPDLKSATLEIRGKIIPPSRVVPVDRGGHLVDDLIVAIQEDRLTAIRTTDGGEAWTTRFKDGRYLQLIAAERQMLFLQQCERRTGRLGRKQYRIVNPGEIQRVSTRDGKWLQPLVTGTPHLGKKTLQTLAVVTSTNRVFVLEMDSRNSDLHETQINSYRISCFTGGKTKPQWQKNYKSAGDVPSVGVGILFQGDPLYAKSKLKRLSIVGDI